MTSRCVVRAMLGVVLAASSGAATLGCFNQDPARPLTGDAFVSRRVEGRANPQPIDQPGLVIPDGVRPPAYEGTEAPEVTRISPSVREVVRDADAGGAQPGRSSGRATAATGTTRRAGPPREVRPGPAGTRAGAAAPAPATRAATGVTEPPSGGRGAPDPSGQYVIFGTVLAEVNDQPIFAHKVLTVLDSALRAEAQRYDAESFREVAAKLIVDEIRHQLRNELVFAAAQKSLTPRERELADALAAQWRNTEITKAGGSIELAKRRWADEGWDFDEQVEYQYRAAMTAVYYQKRVRPLVQVTASDIRRYYDANREREFTRPARAKFRVIRIDHRNPELELAGPEDARRLAERIRAEAAAADFDALARRANDPVLKESGGVVPGNEEGWLPRGTYVSEKLEDAVWQLEPGQVTDLVEERGAFYVARLDERQDAEALQFEDLAVQEQIRDRLEAQQLRELTEREHNRLLRDAVVQEQPQMLQTAVAMAMQRYAAWAAAR